MLLETLPVPTTIICWSQRLLTGLALGLVATLNTQAADLIVGDQSYSARTVMEAAGVLKDLPYELEWKQFTAGSPVAEALNVGSLDIGLLGDSPALFMGALGAPIKVIGVSRQNLDGVAIVVRKDSPIKTVADLAGKKVAIWKGSFSQQLMLTALDRAGVARDAVDYRYLSALDSSHALDGCSVDAIATWEPLCHSTGASGRTNHCNCRRLDPCAKLYCRQRSGHQGQARADQRFPAAPASCARLVGQRPAAQ